MKKYDSKFINLDEARNISKEVCDYFKICYCEVYYVDRLEPNTYGEYYYLEPQNILLLDDININKNPIGVLIHELTHHIQFKCYPMLDSEQSYHGYFYNLARKKIIKYCKKYISKNAEWKTPLKAYQNDQDMEKFKL